jgi:predicted DNA-binding transcriptional regulator AlpA
MRLIYPDNLPDKGIRTSDAQRRRLENAGKFPRRVQITKHAHAYLLSEIDGYLAERINAREMVAA